MEADCQHKPRMNERGSIHIHNIDMQYCCLVTSVSINIASWSYFNTWEGVPLVEYHRVSSGEGIQRQIKLILLTLVINVWACTEHQSPSPFPFLSFSLIKSYLVLNSYKVNSSKLHLHVPASHTATKTHTKEHCAARQCNL